MPVSPHDRDILRRLAAAQAEIAQLPVHQVKAEMWRRLNDLEPVRPMVWINEICWNEVNVDDELTLRCEDPWLREVEFGLKDDTLIEVIFGIVSGERVVTGNSFVLKAELGKGEAAHEH